MLDDRATRGDKLVEPSLARSLMQRPAAVEEKVDGTNLGISLADDGRLRAQNRGAYVDGATHPQYQPLGRWLGERAAALRDELGDQFILFGEWCFARHTVTYDRLPDWFLAFDVYDRDSGRFWSRHRRDRLCADLNVATVPLLADAVVARRGMEALMGSSRLSEGAMEGIYLRWDDGDWLDLRAKVVRAGWVAPDEQHWATRAVQPNRLRTA